MKFDQSEAEKELEELKPIVKRYHELSGQLASHLASERLKEKDRIFTNIKFKTRYLGPVYPDMGVAAENGYAYFSSKEDAEALVKAFNGRSYNYTYSLKWTEVGEYSVVPDYTTDSDSEVVYTATFVRSEK